MVRGYCISECLFGVGGTVAVCPVAMLSTISSRLVVNFPCAIKLHISSLSDKSGLIHWIIECKALHRSPITTPVLCPVLATGLLLNAILVTQILMYTPPKQKAAPQEAKKNK